MKYRKKMTVAIAIMLALVACSKPAVEQAASGGDTENEKNSETVVYVNADIVTVAADNPSASALAIRDGLILAVGSREEVEAAAGKVFTLRDLEGKTLIPGLIDAHGHISLTALSKGFANVQPPPAGPIKSIAQLQKVMKLWDETNPDALWLMGWGYDDSLLEEGRHPSKEDLDQISTDKPIMLSHVSGHLMACNSKCLEMAGISKDTVNPPGGVIQRMEDGKTPNGVLEESAVYKVYGILPAAPEVMRLAMLEQVQ
ncbi:MAG: putative amidohydrolase YtcJ, partial [Gammaproteobacteria bacterium]